MLVRSHLSSLCCVLIAVGCTPPPPPGNPVEVTAIAGQWRGADIRLDIDPQGGLSYERSGSASVKLDGDIESLSSTGFDVDTLGFKTHFVINALPTTSGAETTMTIDGHTLTKLKEEHAPSSPTQPAPPPAAMPAAGTLESLVGHWVSSADGVEVNLNILADGTLHYRKVHGGNTTSLDGVKVQDITATSFAAGVFGMTTTFRVDAAPAVVDGVVRMTVDGVVLTKMAN